MTETPDKPFKTIEVIDRHTGQPCKVACMSCIRGHRTTSCGIPVCRSKVFWTVKRPGRPSNSCTCRYGATGGCRCVTAKSVCPHKAKKGEKRSGECRCDEQGRYCCLLEQDGWKALTALQKPQVDFYPTREALEDIQNRSLPMTTPSTPFSFHAGSPFGSQNGGSTHGTPAPQVRQPSINIVPSPYENLLPQRQASITPRFGMMGLGGPQGSESPAMPDPMAWDFSSPPTPGDDPLPQQVVQSPPQQQPGSCCGSSAPTPAPQPLRNGFFAPPQQQFEPMPYAHPTPPQIQQQEQPRSCCQSSAPTPAPQSTQTNFFPPPQNQFDSTFAIPPPFQQQSETGGCCQSGPPQQPQNFTFPFDTSNQTRPQYQSQPYQQQPFDYDRLMATYQSYQYPNAICQKCGLNGCTCSNCPPTMQNYLTGSWAQSCARTHAMAPKATAFAPSMAQLQQQAQQNHGPTDSGISFQHQHSQYPTGMFDARHPMNEPLGLPETQAPVGYEDFVDSPGDLLMGDVNGGEADALAYSDFLMGELDRPT